MINYLRGKTQFEKAIKTYPHWQHLELMGENTFHRAIGVIPGCTYLPEGDQPERYSGPLPSFECLSFIRKMEEEHNEWVAYRAALTED